MLYRCGPAAAEKRKLPLPLTASSSTAPPNEKQPRQCDDNGVDVEPLQPLDMRRSRPSVIRRCSAVVRSTHEERESPLPSRLLRSSTAMATGMTGMRGASDQPDPAYAALFASPTEPAGSALTVDDHFARALGPDTWLRLQDGLTSS
ncbi:hypothetical protein HPB50_003468 [Hyalomma asiaticum]|uniref:Uncharacterized protein n=1 Tax=Hyalomma asiaticum TaxID=266040 RepID=A0ACB7RXT2_HYAAI|nr:hypothetical protein HPB50_003468 [Hyalomma asiaticum]